MNPELIAFQAIRKLIESGWTKKVHATDKDGHCVHAWSSDAVCWCLSGAYIHIAHAGMEDHRIIRRMINKADSKGFPSVADWNDAPSRTKDEVLAFIDECIAECF